MNEILIAQSTLAALAIAVVAVSEIEIAGDSPVASRARCGMVSFTIVFPDNPMTANETASGKPP